MPLNMDIRNNRLGLPPEARSRKRLIVQHETGQHRTLNFLIILVEEFGVEKKPTGENRMVIDKLKTGALGDAPLEGND